MEYLPFRVELNEGTGEAFVVGRFAINPELVPNLEATRKEYLADLEKDLVSKGLPEELKARRDQLQDLLENLGSSVEECKGRIHALGDDRDGLWRGGKVPSVSDLEKADEKVDAERTRLANLVTHLDGANARLEDLHREISEQVRKAARDQIRAAVEFAPSEQKAINALLALFDGPNAENLVRACLKHRLAWDFSDRSGSWVGTVDSISGKAAHALLNGPGVVSPADDADGDAGESDLDTTEEVAQVEAEAVA